MKVTVREVAKAADVSIGTVSRVFNGHVSVNPQKAERVIRVAQSLNYIPLRGRARMGEQPLAGKNIALVLLGMDRSLVSLPVVAAAIHGTEAAVAKAGGSLFLANIPTLDQIPPLLQRDEIDGLILKGALQGGIFTSTSNALLGKLRSLPSVWLLGRPEGAWGDVVGADDATVGRMAAEYLYMKGHRDLAFVNPKADHVTFRRREMSFTWRAQELGARVHRFVGGAAQPYDIPLRPIRDVGGVQKLIDSVLNSDPKPTAIFAPGDSIAALIYRALATRQLQVGSDISMISSNNERMLTSGLYPALTTIDTHAEEIGARAVSQLEWRLREGDGDYPVEINLEPTLVEGSSVVIVSEQ